MFDVVILAAGEAKRFGSPKQLASWKGKPLIQDIVTKCRQNGLEPIVCLGAHYDEIIYHQDVDFQACTILRIQNWSIGLSASIKESLVYIQSSSKYGVLFLLADQPLFSSDDLRVLQNKISMNFKNIVCMKYEGSVGVPAYFPKSYFGRLKSLSGDQGAKSILISSHCELVESTHPMIDIDSPADITKALKMI